MPIFGTEYGDSLSRSELRLKCTRTAEWRGRTTDQPVDSRREGEEGRGARWDECWKPRSRPRDLLKIEKGYLHCAINCADKVIIVRKPDGTIGAGTADELMHAVGTWKPITWGSW